MGLKNLYKNFKKVKHGLIKLLKKIIENKGFERKKKLVYIPHKHH